MSVVSKNMDEPKGGIAVLCRLIWSYLGELLESCRELVTDLMKLNPNKHKYYQQGLRGYEAYPECILAFVTPVRRYLELCKAPVNTAKRFTVEEVNTRECNARMLGL